MLHNLCSSDLIFVFQPEVVYLIEDSDVIREKIFFKVKGVTVGLKKGQGSFVRFFFSLILNRSSQVSTQNDHGF